MGDFDLGNFSLSSPSTASHNIIADWWRDRGPHAYSTPGATIDPAAFDAKNGWAAAGANPGYFGAGQRTLADALTAQMNGGGPNLADAQLKQATNRNLSNAAALQASARGGNPALAARNTAINQAGIAQEAAGQSGIQRMEGQLAAQSQLGNVLGQGKGQELEQAGQANQASQAGQALNVQNTLGAAAINAPAQTANNQLGAQYLGAGMNAIGAIGSGAQAMGLFHDGGEIPSYDGGGMMPGVDHGRDEMTIGARPGEVMVNQESAAYPMAKAIIESEHGGAAPPPAPPTGHPMGRRILDWMLETGRSLGSGNIGGVGVPSGRGQALVAGSHA